MTVSSLALQAQSGKITGTVKDQQGSPIEFATVRLIQNGIIKSGANTDMDGKFTISLVEPGAYEIQAQHAGNSSPKVPITIKPGENPPVNLVIHDQVELSEVVITEHRRQRDLSKATMSMDVISPKRVEEQPHLYLPVTTHPDPIAQPRTGAEGDQQPEPSDREGYDHIEENRFLDPAKTPQSTFSIDVDAASYSNVRRFIQTEHRRLPQGQCAWRR
ncbi:MAG: von Willebrand factor type A domain-containing protein [Bacteroidia bacterium]